MTEPTGAASAPHLTLDELADVLAGEPAGSHLAGCASCTARLGELRTAEAAVLASLADLPAPTLPAGLADRLQAALAAEPALRPATAATGAPAGPATVTPLGQRRARRTWVPAVAASAVLLIGGAVGWSLLSDGGPGAGSSPDTAAGATAESGAGTLALPTSSTGIDYGDQDLVEATLPAVLAGVAPGGTALDSAQSSGPGSGAGSAPQPTSAREAGPAGPPPEGTGGLAGATSADPLARLREPAALASCLAALLPPENPDERPLALDYASYRGTPALAVVLPDPDPAKVSVFLVGAACSQADDATLFFVRADRP